MLSDKDKFDRRDWESPYQEYYRKLLEVQHKKSTKRLFAWLNDYVFGTNPELSIEQAGEPTTMEDHGWSALWGDSDSDDSDDDDANILRPSHGAPASLQQVGTLNTGNTNLGYGASNNGFLPRGHANDSAFLPHGYANDNPVFPHDPSPANAFSPDDSSPANAFLHGPSPANAFLNAPSPANAFSPHDSFPANAFLHDPSPANASSPHDTSPANAFLLYGSSHDSDRHVNDTQYREGFQPVQQYHSVPNDLAYNHDYHHVHGAHEAHNENSADAPRDVQTGCDVRGYRGGLDDPLMLSNNIPNPGTTMDDDRQNVHGPPHDNTGRNDCSSHGDLHPSQDLSYADPPLSLPVSTLR